MGDDAAARSKRLVGLLSRVLKDAEDLQLIEQGAQVMGRLVKVYAGVSSEIVEQQVRAPSGWLQRAPAGGSPALSSARAQAGWRPSRRQGALLTSLPSPCP